MRIDQGQGAQCKGKQSVLASALVVLGLQAGAQTIQDQQAIDQQRRAEQRQAQQAAQLVDSPLKLSHSSHQILSHLVIDIYLFVCA